MEEFGAAMWKTTSTPSNAALHVKPTLASARARDRCCYNWERREEVDHLLGLGPCCGDRGRRIGPGQSARPGREAPAVRRAREKCCLPNRRCERSIRCAGLTFPPNAERRNPYLRSPRTTCLELPWLNRKLTWFELQIHSNTPVWRKQ